MSKKQKQTEAPEISAVPPTVPQTAAEPAAPKVEKPKTRIQYSFVKDVDAAEKIAPQARVIVETVKALGTAPREALVTLLSDGRLKTRQPAERVLTYYQKALETKGYVKMEKIAA